MIAESLARKYRPKIWDDIVGQDATVERLKNIIANKKVPHALLFTGNFGCGKTTFSRMLAAYLSCDSEKEVKKFNTENHPDILEINAGADAKIDDIRALTDSARFRPQFLKYKIVCIDEAQGIAQAARNAFLKPLEEPPAHTIYILSSMEPEKLNQAVVSRCSVFNLDAVSAKDISKRLLYIGEKENFKWLDKKIALQIGDSANGSVRQGVSNLESVAQYIGKNKNVNIEKVLDKVINFGADSSAQDILFYVYKKDLKNFNDTCLSCPSLVTAINKMTYLNMYLIDTLLTPNNKKVAHWGENKEFAKRANMKDKDIEKLLKIQDAINKIKLQFGSFMFNERSIVISEFSKLILK